MEFHFGEETILVNVKNRAALLAEARSRFRAGEGFALATINLDHLVKLQEGGAFLRAYQAQDLVVADGNPIVWLSKLAGQGVELVPGSDMVLPLTWLAAEEGVPVGLVGSTEAALEAAAEAMRGKVPGLNIVAKVAPPMGFDPEGESAEAVFAALEEAGARMVFLALGAPKQELFAARGRARLPGVGFASIGAGLDFLAGTQVRAPRWVRMIAMEWAWRMLSSPARMVPRYAKCAVILPGHMGRALGMRLRGR
ncbi:WecB/TagA/CpsF family glycosyltransferase [Rhodalgimonas zhirmunskyi]|uniref:WecB/TagA/CpsF family glycosyltransferase n=1 Tax=Rhodalgimonas zhirmunskyi TaxID=2964767 RepID=A0AAJ1U4R5_9RHOB|nr:WecB/TagA/CpsF family glycosyltransferase [Rhodoalgimonas zhirmunskyi]MDQ2093155.1 WecB/TagA/CpsF family glycosyltransferase [Rhodoalgimonas zhirmunskyi]